MRKYFATAFVTAVAVSAVFLVALSFDNPVSHSFRAAADKSQVAQDLASDQAFVASLQSKLGTADTTAAAAGAKGDKGDTGSGGLNGSAGTDGTAGSNGIDGSNGSDGSAGQTGPQGPAGADGAQGPQGEQGLKGDTGAKGDTGGTGATGAKGDTGAAGPAGVVQSTATGLTYTAGTQTLALTSGYVIPTTASAANWDTAYGWGDHALAGYAVQAGLAGGQTLVGGTAANNVLTLQGNSASGNTAVGSSILFKVGDAGATTAMAILNNGNIGLGTTASYAKLNVNGAIATTSEGDIFSQRDSGDNATYPVISRYFTGNSTYPASTFIFGSGTNALVGIEKPGSQDVSHFQVRAVKSSFDGKVGIGTTTPGSTLTVKGSIAVSTTGSDAITPIQFVQITGLGDNPTLTSFNGTSYPVADWNAAVVGFANGGACGTAWSGGTENGFQYWWGNSSGNWQLTVDINGPQDGCNKVQVMFVRKELSTRVNYGF